MKRRPTHVNTAGARYLALRKLARERGRPTAEFLQMYALEGFLGRLARSPHRDRLVLKGGVLLAAFELRRPTRDIDFLALRVDNEPAVVGQLVAEVAGVELNDGLVFLIDTLTSSPIRDDDLYPGIRTRLQVQLATAKMRFQADINVGDPVVPEAITTEIPTLLPGSQPAVQVLAYPRTMVIAEKLVTALQRGRANTRMRDFADLHLMLARSDLDDAQVTASIAAVARHRRIALATVRETLAGMPEVVQPRWETWLSKHGMDGRIPSSFAEVMRGLDVRTHDWITSAAEADSNSDRSD